MSDKDTVNHKHREINNGNEGPSKPKRRRSLEEKLNHEIRKHPLRPPCSCSRQCLQSINQPRRIDIYSSFWKLDYFQRKTFIHNSVLVKEPVTMKKKSFHNRQVVYVYRLKDSQGDEHTVCKEFYLTTLGYSASSTVVAVAKAAGPSTLAPSPDQRGKKTVECNPTHEKIKEHIKSYNPCISHYRREHAPNRFYLPNELTITEMHIDYNAANPSSMVDYSTYRRRVCQMNIGFAPPGAEECESCEIFQQKTHEQMGGKCVQSCQVCADLAEHLLKAREAQEQYKLDGAEYNPDVALRSIELQKVMMLPRLSEYKSVRFTRRLVAFHLTLSPIGEYSKHTKTNSVVWNESMAGRKCEDIASALLLAMVKDRDASHLIFYLHNYAAQNKNYTLFTAIIQLLQSKSIQAKTVTLKYLEAGHTIMSVDSTHAKVEKEMRHVRNVYDFYDFEECIRRAGANVIIPALSDFRAFKGMESQTKLQKSGSPLLASMWVIQLRCDSELIYYKQNYTDQDYKKFDYLAEKKDMSFPTSRQEPRGIPLEKRSDIVAKLLPLMPENRHAFWKNLPTSQAKDLIDNDD